MSDGRIMNIMNAAQERVTNGYAVINTDHANLHAHQGYSINKDSTNLAANASIYLQFNTGTSVYVHFKLYEASMTNSLGRFSILEYTTNSTFTNGSSAVTYYNKSRVNASSYTSDLEIYADPTDVDRTSGWNILESIITGSSGTQAIRTGAWNRSLDVEWVLAQNSTYVLELTNIGPTAGQGMIYAFWYEEGGA